MRQHQEPDNFHDEDDDLDRYDDEDEEDPEELGTPVYQGTGLSVRALTAEELQRFLDAHADQPAQLLGSGWAALDAPGHSLGGPRTPAEAGLEPPGLPAAVPAGPVSGSHGSPGRSALAAYRRNRAEELAAWTRSLAWRAPLVAAAGLAGDVLAAQAGLPWAGLVGLAVAALASWRLRFRPSEQARTWQRGAAGERHTARLLDRLTRDGYVVFHDLAVPGSPANVDHLVIGPSGVFVIDSKQWTGSVHQSADGLAWHNHYRLDRTIDTMRWEAETVGRLLGTRIHPCCASTAPTSTAAACTPRAWRSSPPTCSATRSAMTGCCRTPTSTCSPPPPGPASARPPERGQRPAPRDYGGRADRRSDGGV
jgi:Nuclease-related domain